MDALTRNNAIVVGERVYITLSGMDPDTTYYVKVNPVLVGAPHLHSMMDGELGGKDDSAANIATVVVKTMPLTNGKFGQIQKKHGYPLETSQWGYKF